jgi:hypothetical protein
MAMTRRRVATLAAAALALVAALAYLRDPPWLLHVTSGLSTPERDEAGVEFRWTRGHASFFVPADAPAVVLSMRSLNDTPSDRPITVTISIDDRPAEVVSFQDESWRDVRLPLPPAGRRRVRRIDLKLDRLRSQHRGVQLREPQILSSR